MPKLMKGKAGSVNKPHSKKRSEKSNLRVGSSSTSAPGSEDDMGYMQTHRQFSDRAKNATWQAQSKSRGSYTVTCLALAAERSMSLRKLVDGKAADALVQNIYGRFSTMGVLAQSLYVARMNVDSGKVVKSPWTPTGSDQLSDRAEDLFSLCKDLLSRYDLTSIELATDDAQLHFEGDWDADCRKLQNLLDIGRQATEAQIQGLLSSEESVTKDNAEISTTEVDKNTMAWREATAPDQEKGSGEGWGIVAKKTERGVGRLIKVVSEEL